VEIPSKGLNRRETRLTAGVRNPAACGGFSVIILVVARRLMEQKYSLYIAQGHQAFADAWVCSEMCRLQLLSSLTGELARLVHHIMDDPEQQESLIDQFHGNLDIRMRGHLFTAPEPLPPLPEGAILPFALLSQREETPDE
jgi:hypothetical protein